MTENEAKIFIQNAMEQSKNVLAELMLIMPKVFAAKRKSLGEYYSNLENCKKEIQSCEVAIQALEEVQRWHTSVVNPNIKNEVANRSTQICVNCDHKDEYIEELEAEVEPYRALEKRLTDMFGGELSLEDVTDELERYLKEPDNTHPINAKILTYEDAAAWDAYRAIGTPEELQEMKKDFAEALSDWRQYRKVGTLEECRAAVEKQTAKRPRIMGNAMICPSCPRCFKSDNSAYCPSCGQKLKWEDEE